MYDNYFYYDMSNGIAYFERNIDYNVKVDNMPNDSEPVHIKQIRYVKDFWLLCRNIPFFSAILNLSFYSWLLIFLVLYLFVNKKMKFIVPFIPSIVILLFCLVSPVNGNRRYIYPIVYSMPILIDYVSVVKIKE